MMDKKEVYHQWFIRFEEKTPIGAVKNETMQNKELAEELHRPIIRKFEKRKEHPCFIDNIWGVDLSDMKLLTNFNKGILFFIILLIFVVNYCIEIYSTHNEGNSIVTERLWELERTQFTNLSLQY